MRLDLGLQFLMPEGEPRRLRSIADLSDAGAWLSVAAVVIPGLRRAVVVGSADGRFAPAAIWPPHTKIPPALASAAQDCLDEERELVRENGDVLVLACPVTSDDATIGVVAVELGCARLEDISAAQDLLRWGVGWLVKILGPARAAAQGAAARQRLGLETLVAAMEQPDLTAATRAAATHLAHALKCERVSIGLVRNGAARLVAVSSSASFGRGLELAGRLTAAMEEAVEQRAPLVYPRLDADDPLVLRFQRELAGDRCVVATVPLLHRGQYLAAAVAEWPLDEAPDAETLEAFTCAAALTAPVLLLHHANDRLLVVKAFDALCSEAAKLLGSAHLGRKAAALALIALIAAAWLAEGEYRVTARARVEGSVERAVVAPFDGYVADAFARAGDIVAPDQMLARLDDREFALERLNWVADRAQRQAALERALGERKRAEASIVHAQIERAEAQIALLDQRIDRTRLRAPFAGVVVAGDLSRSVGGSVQRGEELFRIAPLDAYRVVLAIAEEDFAAVAAGQTGTFISSSLPNAPVPIVVERVTPVAQARDGRTVFRSEAALKSSPPGLRPEMEGVAKIDIGRRRLAWIWTHPLIEWLSLRLWAWTP